MNKDERIQTAQKHVAILGVNILNYKENTHLTTFPEMSGNLKEDFTCKGLLIVMLELDANTVFSIL